MRSVRSNNITRQIPQLQCCQINA